MTARCSWRSTERACGQPEGGERPRSPGGSWMGYLLPFEDKRPLVADDAFIAPTAVLIGDVVVEEGASVWFGVVLRGDFNRIVVGSGTSVQDNSVIHTNEDLPTVIGSNVTVGHLSLLEGCEIEDGALIGMGSIVLNRARVGRRAMLAAGGGGGGEQQKPTGGLACAVAGWGEKKIGGC